MAETKTRPNTGDVDEFLAQVDEARRGDAQAILAMMEDVSGQPPVLWGTMIGFGQYHYRYASGHEGDAFRIGFAPRKGDISLYLLSDDEKEEALLHRLGKHKRGKSCLYVRRLADIDTSVLRDLTQAAWSRMAERYPQ
jgi:hypothetical protein